MKGRGAKTVLFYRQVEKSLLIFVRDLKKLTFGRDAMKVLKLFFTISFFIFQDLFPQSLILKNVSFYDSEILKFSEPKNIIIKKEIIEAIEDSKSKNIDFFVLPTFCDIGSTLSSDSLGGFNSTADIDLSIKSYISHGFSHVLLVNNPNWLMKYILEKKIKVPVLFFSERSIINKSSEYSYLPEEIYFSVDNFPDARTEIQRQINKKQRVIYLLNRFFKESEFNFQEEHFRELLKLDYKNSILIVSNFAEPQSIFDSIRSEISFLRDPIPLEVLEKISTSSQNKISYIPELNVYYNLVVSEDKEELTDEIEKLSFLFPFYKKYYQKISKSYSESKVYDSNKHEKATKEFQSYKSGIMNYSSNFKNIINSGGTGNLLSFPGISALREVQLLSEIQETNQINIDYIYNACQLISTDYSGRIMVGEKANLLLYKKNPLVNISQLTKFDRMYVAGSPVKRND